MSLTSCVALVVASACAALTSVAVAPAVSAADPVVSTGYVDVDGGGSPAALRYQLHLPAAEGTFPVLVVYQGYSDHVSPRYVAEFVRTGGYALLTVGTRGTGCSSGTWDLFTAQQGEDGADVVEWAARQPWSDGRVGMVGPSYAGIMQLLVAAERPPSLRAIAPGAPIADLYRDVAHPGGIPNTAVLAAFGAGRESGSAQRALQGAFPVSPGQADPRCLEDRDAHATNLTTTTGLMRARPEDGAYYRERSPIETAGRIEVPTFLTVAWQDQLVGSRSAELLTALGPRAHGILTNGTHNMYEFDFLDEVRAFMDRKVRGDDDAAAPRLQVYWEMSDDGIQPESEQFKPAWTSEIGHWPPSQVRAQQWFLGRDGLQPAVGAAGADTYTYAPGTGQSHSKTSAMRPELVGTVPVVALWEDLPAPQPGTSALAYTSPPLDHDVAMLGSASLDLWLSSTAVDTDVQVVLSEVKGQSAPFEEVYVQGGWLRASHRALDETRSTPTRPYHRHTGTEPLTPATATPLRVEIRPFGHVFRKGSRIRIWVEAPAAVPQGRLAPSQSFGHAFEPVQAPAVNTVHFGGAHPSALTLPVLPVDVPPADRPCRSLYNQQCRRIGF